MLSSRVPLTIPAVLDRAASRFSDLEGLVDGDVRMSFAELAQSAHQVAAALSATGVVPGDRVAVWAPNVGEWVLVALAVHSIGAVLIPINTRFKGHEASHILRASSARILFTVTDFLDTDYTRLLEEAGQPEGLEKVVVMRGACPSRATSWPAFLENGRGVDPREVRDRAAAVQPDDVCDILFTSGTTGAPKGAVLTHRGTVRAYDAWSTVVGLRAGDRYLIVNPFFHAFGLKAGILACLIKGATIVPHAVFDVDAVMARVAEEKVSMLPGPPAIYQSILDHPDLDRYDMSSLRLAVTGAAAVPVEMIERMRKELAFETIVTGYGLTEATGIATMCRHDDDARTIAETAGRPIPGVEVRTVDDAGDPTGTGEPGEVLVRGYNVMKGYLDDPGATAEVMAPGGWLRTGDIGVIDERGNLRITDRKKDMFIVGGFNAYPAEIESLILGHPDVAQVAVIGVADGRLGEVGAAFVVPRSGREVDRDALIEWCRGEMANFKVPRHVWVVDELPRNASGKVLKYELREDAGLREDADRRGGRAPQR